MLLITDNIKYNTQHKTKLYATITTPITVNLSRYGELGKDTDIDYVLKCFKLQLCEIELFLVY